MLATAGQPIPCEVTLDPGLSFVAMKVFDVSAGYPGTLVSTHPMVEYNDAAYGANFTGIAGKAYVVTKAVYTDGTYTVRDQNYASGSDSFQVMSASMSAPSVEEIVEGIAVFIAGAVDVVGEVESDDEVSGIIDTENDTVLGIVEEC